MNNKILEKDAPVSLIKNIELEISEKISICSDKLAENITVVLKTNKKNLLNFIHFCTLAVNRIRKNSRLMRASHRKGIGAVSGGGRKPHPQKRLGRARAGSIRAINIRKGANAFGSNDNTKVRTPLFANKKFKRLTFSHLIINYIKSNRLILLDDNLSESKARAEIVKRTSGLEKKKVLLVNSGSDMIIKNLSLSHIHVVWKDELNVLDILHGNFVIIEKSVFVYLLNRIALPEKLFIQ